MSEMVTEAERTVQASTEYLEEIVEFINEQLILAKCSSKIRMQIDIAVDEVFSNIAQYAYKDGEGTVTVRIRTENKAAILNFMDSGIPFNPLHVKNPDLLLSAKDRQEGGLGIFLVKKYMDEATYAYKQGQNILTLKKYFL